jgi:hypothetical protein
MTKLIYVTVLALLLCAARSEAAIVTAGNIFPLFDDGGSQSSTTVDHWGFTVNAADTIVMDILSYEGSGSGVDVNGDGEIAFFDPHIYLFRDDGTLNISDEVNANDDAPSPNGFADGSITTHDSYLSEFLPVGNYILAIGAFSLSTANAILGDNSGGVNATGWPSTVDGTDIVPNDHGDYRITWTGDITITSDPGTADDPALIPEPSTAVIWSLLGTIAATLRWRRRNSRRVELLAGA